MKEEKVSVIVPVYNVEKYVGQCLKSLTAQTYQNLEIIVIDDGSTDGSGKICDEFATGDKRVKVFHKSNGGLSSARNFGLGKCTGNYVTFVDSDDYVEKDYVRSMVEILESYKVDIVSCRAMLVSKQRTKKGKKCNGDVIVLTKTEAINEMLYQKELNSSAWGKLYKRQLFDKLQFPDVKTHEDLSINYQLLKRAKHVALLDINLYNYRQRTGSIINSEFSEDTLDALSVVEEIANDARGGSNEPAAESRKINAELYIIRQLPERKYKKLYTELLLDIKRHRGKVLADKNIRFKTRIGLLASYLGMPVLKFFYAMMKDAYLVKRV